MNVKRLLLIGTLLVLANSLLAQEAPADAFEETLQELTERRDTPQFADFLERAVAIAPDIGALDQLVSDHLPYLPPSPRRAEVLVRIGTVFELAHRVETARQFYAEAARISPEDDHIGLRFAAVSLELGNIQEAIITLTRIVNNPDSASTQRTAAVYRARAFYLNGEIERAVLHAESLAGLDRPEESATDVDIASLFLLGDILNDAGRETQYRELQGRIRTLYPDAPETALFADNRSENIRLYPTPSRLAFTQSPFNAAEITARSADDDPQDIERTEMSDGSDVVTNIGSDQAEEQRTAVAGVQTGSFRDRENAEYMARDVEAFGFSADIREVKIEGQSYFRVIVPVEGDTTEDAQQLVVELKERGVEGFLVFEEVE